MRTGVDRTCHYCGREAVIFAAGHWLCNEHTPVLKSDRYTRSDLEGVAQLALDEAEVNTDAAEVVTRYLASKEAEK